MATPPAPPSSDFTIPDVLPVLPLRDAIVLPLTAVPLAVGQPRSLQLVDDVSIVRGAHQIGFGANYIRSGLQSTSYGSAAGNFAFTGVNTGLGLADFLLGRPATFTQGQIYGPGGVMPYIGVYGQDAWKVSPNLTLNVGLRWDPYLPYSSDQRHFIHFSREQFKAGAAPSTGMRRPACSSRATPVIRAMRSAGSTSTTSPHGCRACGIRRATAG